MADMGVGELNSGSHTDGLAQGHLPPSSTDRAKLTPSPETQPPSDLRLTQAAATAWNFNVETSFPRHYQFSSLDPLTQNVTVSHHRLTTQPCRDQLRESENQPSEPEKDNTLSGIRTETDFTAFASPADNMGAVSRPVLLRSHTVAFGVDTTLPQGNSNDNDDDNQLMPPPLLQPATFAVPANLRGAASKVQAATERPPPSVSSIGSTTESESERKVLNRLDTWQRDSFGFCAGPSSDFRSLRRCESLGFDSNCSFGFDDISCSGSSSSTMPSQQLPMPRGEAAATPGGQFIHPADGSSQGPGGKWRTSRRAWLRHRPLCRGDSRTVTAASPSCDRDEPKAAAAEAVFRSGGDATCGDHYGGRSESHRPEGATATPLPSNHGDKRAVVEGSDTPISKPGCTTKMDASTSSSSSSPASRGTREDCREPCSPRPVPPTFHRQLSRRRSYQQATSPTATRVGEDDNDGDDDDDDPEGRVREEEEEEEEENSPSYTPPGSPRSKQRRMDMNSIDPYQVFEVQHLPCIILTVKVIRGRNITNGWAQDLIDTPDPYVKLRLKTAPEGRRQTHTVNDDANPVWNETFTFFLGFSETNILEVSLVEANPFNLDSTIGTVYFNVHDRIREFGKRQLEVFNFSGVPGTSEIDVEFHMDWDQEPTLRYSLCLSDPEKEFMRKRKHKVWLALNELLGEQGPRTVDETPTIAVIGSGGGFRAMTGYSGVFKALASTGLLDCATYACGLSGSSWYLSTLYSHPRWPDMHPGEMQSELMNNIDKSLAWLLAPSSFFRYLNSVLTKRRQGQPVSFTDFFGHMVGETLLKGRLDSRLTDQREKIKDADVPMPLYTCVHVKKDVPARSFQEWVEFSPYEIGLPKYGTFMDSELFGSKFFMGKLARKYQEPPLHFLQGIWGSAFCILFKRLLEDNRNLDPAEMIRQEMGLHDDMGQQLEEEQQNNDSSDISDDSDDDVQDSTGESEEEKAGVSKGARSGRRKSSASFLSPALAKGTASEDSDRDTSDDGGSSSDPQPPQSFLLLRRQGSSEGFDDVDAPRTPTPMEVGSPARPGKTPSRGREEDDGVSNPDSPRKGVRFSHEVKHFEQRHDKRRQQPQQQQQQQQQQARKDRPKPALKKANTVRRGKSRSYWSSLLKGIFENQNFELLSTRAGRAAVIHNFMRGLSLQQTYPLSPFTPLNERVQEGDEFDGIFEMYPTHIKHIYMVDAGLTFNSPYPLVLRPQRDVDVILSFDFSARPSDSTPPFKELLLAAKWAKLNRLPFPPIDPTVVDREGLKELYVFQDPDDPNCPVVLHFPLVNITFRNFSAPGVPRTNQTEMDFADFDLFDDPALPYSTFNFTYTNEQFRRLSQLTEFNTLHSLDEIKRVLAEVVARKRQAAPRVPVHPREFKLLRMKSVQEQRQLKKFLKRMESRGNVIKTPTPTSTTSSSCSSRSSSGSTPPATPFFTPTPRLRSVPERNPFIFHTKSSSSSASSSSSTDSPQRENPFFNTSRQHSQTKHRDGERPGAPTGSAARRQVTPTPRRESSKHGGFFSASSTPPPSSSFPSSSSYSSPCSSFFPSVSRDSSGDDVFRRGPVQPSSASSRGSPRPCLSRNGHSDRQTSPSVGSVRHDSSASSGPSRQSSGLSRGLSEDEFYDAAEAFTRDGAPVTNEREAKMHYEGAKERRRLLRRQSTITSLNSITECISLDSAEQDDKLTPALSQTSSNGPESIDVDDLDLFEGTAASAYDDDNDSGEENWFDCHNGSSVRHGSVVTLASDGGS